MRLGMRRRRSASSSSALRCTPCPRGSKGEHRRHRPTNCATIWAPRAPRRHRGASTTSRTGRRSVSGRHPARALEYGSLQGWRRRPPATGRSRVSRWVGRRRRGSVRDLPRDPSSRKRRRARRLAPKGGRTRPSASRATGSPREQQAESGERQVSPRSSRGRLGSSTRRRRIASPRSRTSGSTVRSRMRGSRCATERRAAS